MTWRDRCLMVIALWNGMVFLTYGLDKRKASKTDGGFLKRSSYSRAGYLVDLELF